MKIALIHDYLVQMGGAEKVLAGFKDLYQDSPIFVLINNKQKTKNIFSPNDVKTTWLQRLPFSGKYYQWYLTLMPHAAATHNLSDYDLVLSSASSFAKGINENPGSLHICYCHTPTRYLWHDASYIEDLGYNVFIKKIISLFLPHLKNWDFMAANTVDHFIANSKVARERIKKYYQRDSVVIYPPVETDQFYISTKLNNYYLIGGRLVPYKKYDLAIKAFNKTNLPLKIFGDGPDYKRLRKMARSNIEFLGAVSSADKADLYSHALAFIYPQVEDSGITAVEAMASGRPVIAFGAGGALETVVSGRTGEFFYDQTWESLAYALIHFDPAKYDSQLIKQHAEQFNVSRFKSEINHYIENCYSNFIQETVIKIK